MTGNLDGALLQVRTARNSDDRDRAVADALEEIAKVLRAKERVAVILDLGDYVPKEATHVLLPVSVLEELRKARYGKGMDFDGIDEHVSVPGCHKVCARGDGSHGRHHPLCPMRALEPPMLDAYGNYLAYGHHHVLFRQALEKRLKHTVMPRPAWAPDAPPSNRWLVDGHCPECHSAVKDMSIGEPLNLRCTNEACTWWWWD